MIYKKWRGKTLRLIIAGLIGLYSSNLLAQQVPSQEMLPSNASLQDLIAFALQNQGRLQQSIIDEEIGEREIASALSGWFPQISAGANYNRNIILPSTGIGDQAISMGQINSGAFILQADQNILNPALMQASKAAGTIRERNTLLTEQTRINTILAVSKAFYDILTSHEQVNIIRENIARIQKQLDDAFARYETGIVDKTDYKRAQISLSNSRADLKRVEELLVYKYAYLKELIGMQSNQPLNLAYDYQLMEQEILLDTTLNIDYQNRVEYRQLLALKKLQEINTQYNKWAFLPRVSASYNYAWDFRHDQFSQMYGQHYPRSVFGLNLSLPIFQGTRRVQEIRISRLMEDRLDWDLLLMQQSIDTEYQRALAAYKANLNDWKIARETVDLAEEVYEVIRLQYNEGIKTYLDLMLAETELRTTKLNYLNALNALMSGKLDAEKALGKIE
ncbi:MAG TPA: TolC family protein [Sphingobacteriaceae bacterium]|nr:TolC family protein [Sphingobacteriaceae bacterium]